jgi:serine/threonine protein kinase
MDVEMYFIPDFLAMLGYRFPRDIRNAAPLDSPEYQVGSRRRTAIYPDHLVRIDNRIAFVLEVKSPSSDLERSHIGQLLSYAMHPDVQAEMAVLTNGKRTLVITTRRREPVLEVKQREMPGKLVDLQLLISRQSSASRIGELFIEKRLGKGSFGTVYRAWNASLKRHEAVKIYHADIAVSEASRRRLWQGLRAQAQLHQECIASIYREEGTGAEVWASVQYSPGVTFDKWLKKEAPSARQKIEILVKVARAVNHAHGRGVVHRDLKPSNVLVERAGSSWRPLVVDFDTAVVVGATRLTKTAEAIGTLGFMAPEMSQARPSARFDKRSPLVDIYSLGTLAFFAFFGSPPRAGLASLKIDSLSRRLKELDAGTARNLVTTIIRAMDGEPRIRQDSAEELAKDLEETLSDSQSMRSTTEQERIEEVFLAVDKILRRQEPSGLAFKLYEGNNQVGRFAAIRGVGEALIMHDFDYRELMTGLSFPTTRQYNSFLKNPALASLRNVYGKRLILHPPNMREDGGAYVTFRLSEILDKKPEALAEEAVDILAGIFGILGLGHREPVG